MISPTEHEGQSLIGYSNRIQDRAFPEFQKKAFIWSMIYAFLIAIVPMIGLPLWGEARGTLTWPASLFYGLGTGGIILAIAGGLALRKRMDKTWDGKVIAKYTYMVKRHSHKGFTYYDTCFVIKVKKDHGGIKKHRWCNIPGFYDYYEVNDSVRHHKGFTYYEKYDKSKDKRILCIVCSSFQNMEDECCHRCHCPLLK